MNRQEGDKLLVSALVGQEDGTFWLGTSAYEKRGIAIDVPSGNGALYPVQPVSLFVCPHASIRPVLATGERFDARPGRLHCQTGDRWRQRPAVPDWRYLTNDCTGCGNCVEVCPAKQKALVMKPLDSQLGQDALNFAMGISPKQNPFNPLTVSAPV